MLSRCLQTTDPACRFSGGGYLVHWATVWIPILGTLALAGLNILYISSSMALELAPDEAHYWLWSRQLDWCYYSKGPLVAWLIRASCELFGNTAFAIRFPAVVCSTLTLLAVRELALLLLPARTVIWCLLALLTIPATLASSVLMTIDAPFLCCWAWSTVFIQRAWQTDFRGYWLAAGLLTGLGFLAKYTMILFPVGVGLYLLLQDRFRLGRRNFWLFLAVASLGLLPILLWNAAHDWIGVKHLLSLARVAGEPSHSWRITGPLEFLAGQFLFLQGIWFVAWLGAMVRYRPWGQSATSTRSLFWCLSLSVVGLFFLASFRGSGPLNWAAPAYITGFPLAFLLIVESFRQRNRPGLLVLILSCAMLGLTMSVVSRFPSPTRPLLASLAGEPTPDNPTPIRALDPTCRLSGWKSLAEAVDRCRIHYSNAAKDELLLAGMTWILPGELAFYCQDQPSVYSFGPVTGDRSSQFELWHPNPVDDAQVFLGRSFLYVGELNPDLLQAFDRVSPPVEVLASDGGIPLAVWKIYHLEGFRGFPAQDRTGHPKRY